MNHTRGWKELGNPIPEGGCSLASPALRALQEPRGRFAHQAEAPPHMGTWALQPAWLSTFHPGSLPGYTWEVTASPAGVVRELHRLGFVGLLEQCWAQSAVQLSVCLFKAEAGGEEGVDAETWRVSRDRPTDEAVLGFGLLNSSVLDCA